MSDPGHRAIVSPPQSQLPVTAYSDDAVLAREISSLFRQGPGYVGHELMVPYPGDYATLKGENEGRVLVRNAQGIELLSNVCRHRQAVMLRDRGNVQNIVCPLHRWTYDLKGQLLGAPQFDPQPCVSLDRTDLTSWRGLLFEGPRDVQADLASLGLEQEFDFSGHVLDHIELHVCHYNWKSFIEVYLEDYHVGPFHPGLGQFVTCDDLRWHFGDWFSVQTVGLHRSLRQPGTETYARWHEQVLRLGNGELPKYGAIWLTYYPNIMLEWYPHTLVVSTLIPQGPEKTLNVVEFYYPEEIAAFERDYVESERAAYMETAIEDDEIAMRMDAGRRALRDRGRNETGPYLSPLEDGMQHFHEFLRRQVAY